MKEILRKHSQNQYITSPFHTFLLLPYNSWRASGSKAEKPCFRGSCSAAYNTINYRCRQYLAKEKMCAQADRLWWCGNAEANGRKPV